MKIALDYDGTITSDPLFWSEFIKLSKKHGHLIKIVTFRNDIAENSDLEAFALDNNLEVIYTNKQQKQNVYNAHVWIDDMPITIPSKDSIRALMIEF